MIEVVNLSSKGQLVIPKTMREKMGLKAQDRFILVNDKDSILLKKIKEDEIKVRFNRLFEKTTAAFKKAGITEKDIDRAVKEVRQK